MHKASSSTVRKTIRDLVRDIAGGDVATGRLLAVETIRTLVSVDRSDIEYALRRVLETRSLEELIETLRRLETSLGQRRLARPLGIGKEALQERREE